MGRRARTGRSRGRGRSTRRGGPWMPGFGDGAAEGVGIRRLASLWASSSHGGGGSSGSLVGSGGSSSNEYDDAGGG